MLNKKPRTLRRRAWRVGAAVAVLIAAGGPSAAQAAGKVNLRLLEYQGALPLRPGSEIDILFTLGNEAGSCSRTWSATVVTNEAPTDKLTSGGGVVGGTCDEGTSTSGFVSQLQLTTHGKLTTKVSKLVLSQSHCADFECKFKYNCVYELSKLPSGTITIPGEVEVFSESAKGKLDKKTSGSQCATEEAFGEALEVREAFREVAWAEDTA
jgi:hypothetical protein